MHKFGDDISVQEVELEDNQNEVQREIAEQYVLNGIAQERFRHRAARTQHRVAQRVHEAEHDIRHEDVLKPFLPEARRHPVGISVGQHHFGNKDECRRSE